MDASKQFLKNNDIISFISFKATPKHTFKLLGDEITEMHTEDKIVKGVRYTVEESGERKSFFTGSSTLIARLSEFAIGIVVTVEMKKRKGDDGVWKSYFEISTSEESKKTIDSTEDKTPSIQVGEEEEQIKVEEFHEYKSLPEDLPF